MSQWSKTGTAVLTLSATLVGAAIGAATTLIVWELQSRAQLSAEERSERRAAYTEYADAVSALLDAEIASVRGARDHCSWKVAFPADTTKDVCLVWDSETVDAPRQRWIRAWDQLRIYASPEAVSVAQSLNDEVAPIDSMLFPYPRGLGEWAALTLRASDDTSALTDAMNSGLQPLNALSDAFAKRACLDTALRPDRCESNFTQSTPSMTTPSG